MATRLKGRQVGRIPVYLSHSYRREDRDLNEFFFELLWQAGLTAMVDPQSATFSRPYLESMMRRTPGYIAIVPRRRETPVYQCSPYIVYENRVAALAQRPKAIFVEEKVSRDPFPEGPGVHHFNRSSLSSDAPVYLDSLKRLAEQASGYRRLAVRPSGAAGLILEPGSPAAPLLEILLPEFGFVPSYPPSLRADGYAVAKWLDDLDFLVLERTSTSAADWRPQFAAGRAVPTIRLFRTRAGDGWPGPAPWEASTVLASVAENDDIYYESDQDLKKKLVRHLDKLSEDRTIFTSLEEGVRYFRSAGRRPDKVFVSNAADGNDFARDLSEALRRENITHFQYRYRNDIELSVKWRDHLNDRVRASAIFVPLLTPGYQRSAYCQEELALANDMAREGSLEIIPYSLAGDDLVGIPEQGRDLAVYPTTAEKVARIVTDLDNRLGTDRQTVRTSAAARDTDDDLPLGIDSHIPVDVAFITVLYEEYAAMLRRLPGYAAVPGIEGAPNAHSWVVGEFTSSLYRAPFRFVVAKAARAGTDAAVNVIRNTVLRFHPACVVLVGVAGGLGKVRRGDVLVSRRIWGYEYGKIDGGFEPRPDWNYPADQSIVTAAETLPARDPTWHTAIGVKPPRPISPPTIHVGAVASGNKVIDDTSDPFFQAVLDQWRDVIGIEMEGVGAISAIQDVREFGDHVGFAMIRGVSDLPKSRPSMSAGQRKSPQTTERDQWKNYAAEVAAVLATQLLDNSWPLPPRAGDPRPRNQPGSRNT